MKHSEAAALLTVAAAFDNRKPDRETAQAWAVMLDGLNPADCRDAIMAHYRRSTEWLMPAAILTEVRKIQRARIEAAGHLSVPEEIEAIRDADEFDRAYRAWFGEARRRIAWGEAPEVVAPPRALTARPVDSLTRALAAAKRGQEVQR